MKFLDAPAPVTGVGEALRAVASGSARVVASTNFLAPMMQRIGRKMAGPAGAGIPAASLAQRMRANNKTAVRIIGLRKSKLDIFFTAADLY